MWEQKMVPIKNTDTHLQEAIPRQNIVEKAILMRLKSVRRFFCFFLGNVCNRCLVVVFVNWVNFTTIFIVCQSNRQSQIHQLHNLNSVANLQFYNHFVIPFKCFVFLLCHCSDSWKKATRFGIRQAFHQIMSIGNLNLHCFEPCAHFVESSFANTYLINSMNENYWGRNGTALNLFALFMLIIIWIWTWTFFWHRFNLIIPFFRPILSRINYHSRWYRKMPCRRYRLYTWGM